MTFGVRACCTLRYGTVQISLHVFKAVIDEFSVHENVCFSQGQLTLPRRCAPKVKWIDALHRVDIDHLAATILGRCMYSELAEI